MEDNNHCVYQLYDKRDKNKTPQYTGRTNDMEMCITKHKKVSVKRTEPVNVWKRSIGHENLGFVVIKSGLTLTESCIIEKKHIQHTHITKGGKNVRRS